jgi:hypothetical protein
MKKELIKQKLAELKNQTKNVSEGANELLNSINATIQELKEVKEQAKKQKQS